MQTGDTLTIAPAKGATQRTKNRIRENGVQFIMRGPGPQTTQFDNNNGMWILVESVAHNSSDGKGGKEAWHGWLPTDEIEVTDG